MANRISMAVAVCLLLTLMHGLSAQDTVVESRGDVIVLVGSAGTDEYHRLFTEAARKWVDAATTGGLTVHLFGSENASGASVDDLRTALEQIDKQSQRPLWIALIGHGTFDGKTAKFNLDGPDLAAHELAAMVAHCQRPLAVVNCSSSSGPFLEALSGKNRVLITATKSGAEVNNSRFGEYFAQALADPAADLDKDEQTSLLEAFLRASQQTAEFYEGDGRLATEHALLDDNADGKGTRQTAFRGIRAVGEPAEEGVLLDGVRAHQWHLLESEFDRQLPPEVIQQRNELERQVEELRSRKSQFAEDEYYGQLEQIFLQLAALLPQDETAPAEPELTEIKIPSSIDDNQQPARFYVPAAVTNLQVQGTGKLTQPVTNLQVQGTGILTQPPLLVVLHSWSGNYLQQGTVEPCLKECAKRGWALIHPNFRGPNKRPEACGSDLVVQDVLDAVDWMVREHHVDESRIFLVGASGGGHLCMLLAGRQPERWAGISAWVGISDLTAWHAETKAAGRKYFRDLEAVCGGPPETSDEIDAQYRERSPLTYLDKAAGIPIDLNAGIHDGHTGSVPISHSLRAFNLLATANAAEDQQFSDEQIEQMTKTAEVPGELASTVQEQRKHAVLLRRVAGPVRITLFDGGHEGDMPTAVRWLAELPPREGR